MSASASRTSRVFTISFPEAMAKQVVDIAEEENRNISELFREAFRTYRAERIQRKLAAVRSAANSRAGGRYKPSDVERLVDEVRSEQYRRKNGKG